MTGSGENKKTYDFHIIPSGLLAPSSYNLIGSGCVVNVREFFKELEALEKRGLDAKERLFISDRAHVVFDLHQLVDGLEEKELGDANIGTTKRGIGPCYSTKSARSGVRVGDIYNVEMMNKKLRSLAKSWQKRYGDLLQYDVEEEIARFEEYRKRLQPFVIDQVPLIQSVEKQNAPILIEGANALLLDIDYGKTIHPSSLQYPVDS